MKTNITFRVIADHRIRSKTIPIEHGYKEYTASLNGQSWVISEKSQVMEMLDNMDKSDMMAQYGWDIIIDYYPTPQRSKRSVQEEVEEFLAVVTPHIPADMLRQFSAITYEARDILFGKGKSVNEKIKEILTMMDISDKSIRGLLEFLKFHKNCETIELV